MAWMVRWLLDAIFPPRCAGCGRLGAWFCHRCAAAARPAMSEPVKGLEAIYVGALLAGPIQRAVHEYKYRPRPQLAGPLVALAAPAIVARPDLVVPVPLHPERRRTRGFDQAQALARPLAHWLGVACLDALQRVRDTPAQVGLVAAQRMDNVHGAFRWCVPESPPRRVLLVDDVLTTGATLQACAAAIRAAGGEHVEGAVVARAAAGGGA